MRKHASFSWEHSTTCSFEPLILAENQEEAAATENRHEDLVLDVCSCGYRAKMNVRLIQNRGCVNGRYFYGSDTEWSGSELQPLLREFDSLCCLQNLRRTIYLMVA